jgi:hypothetical protein
MPRDRKLHHECVGIGKFLFKLPVRIPTKSPGIPR